MLRSIKGLKDILPQQTPQWRYMETLAHTLATQSGFSEIRIPIFESTELYARSIGGATDIVEKEMYTFPDRDGSSLTLRPEGTAGVVRAVLEHHLLESPSTRKLYYLGPMFRHERPQAGRYRQFNQFGVEAFGTEDPLMDVEVIALLWRFFNSLGLKDLTLHINSIGNSQDRENYIQEFKRFILPKLELICGNCQRRYSTNPLRILDCKVPICQEATQDAPTLFDHLSPESASHFKTVLDGLTVIDIPFSMNYRLVRGLDYYTRTTFEITTPHLGAQSTIGAGGRYDGLVALLNGPSTPAIGFAVGLERVALLLSQHLSTPHPPLFFVAGFGKDAKPMALKLLHNLRETGIRADTDYKSVNLKSLLRSADKLGASYAIILGDDEARSETAILRNMTTKAQESVNLKEISQKILSLTL
ncbi:MAG: histidine--tRNA ligase [Nitrospirales bacterium]|nr:MAG: histidine--tRNA ligase [Nitrospirales bacterium]